MSLLFSSDVNEKIEGEHVKCGEKDMNEVADILSNGNVAGGCRNGDMQNSEFAGGLELLVDELPKNCVEEDIAMVFSKCGEIKSIRIIRNSSTEKSKDIAFVCFASTEAAKKALTEFKKGIEVLNLTNGLFRPSVLMLRYVIVYCIMTRFCFVCCFIRLKA
jgi:hypothetical protein